MEAGFWGKKSEEMQGQKVRLGQVEFCCRLEIANMFVCLFLHLIPKRFKSLKVPIGSSQRVRANS